MRLIRELYLTEWTVLFLLLDRFGVSGFWLGAAITAALLTILGQLGQALNEAKHVSDWDALRAKAKRTAEAASRRDPEE